jgi:hypothetical protein
MEKAEIHYSLILEASDLSALDQSRVCGKDLPIDAKGEDGGCWR